MATICPAVTATNEHQYRAQIERVGNWAPRLHLDFMDGKLAATQSISLAQAWWPDGTQADLHLMYKRPVSYLREIVGLAPHLVIVHAEAEGDFYRFAQVLKRFNIKVGVALLPKTPVDDIRPALDLIDHVLVFSGHLGHFGGIADLSLLTKVQSLRRLKANLEIGWDGGINDTNAHLLAAGGVDVLNAGGFIQQAANPASAYAKLKKLI